MADFGTAPQITIKGRKGDILLTDYHFENFRYIEDINSGFPTIEFGLKDNLFDLLREGLFGDEELVIDLFQRGDLKFEKKSFRIKSLGSKGVKPRPAGFQTLKLIAIDQTYDSILKNKQSIYFLPSEKKKISDLLKKLLSTVGIKETASPKFKIDIEETAPLVEYGFQNLFIPYSRDPIKVIRKLSNYATTPDGTGGFIFFINHRGLYFKPISRLFVDVTPSTPTIQITDFVANYGINELRLSTYNAFSNFVTGHEKKVLGFNLLEKDYNSIWYKPNARYIEHSQYIDKPEVSSNIKTMPIPQMAGKSISIPFSKDFLRGNIKCYYTPLDNPLALKAFADKVYYSQMFNFVLELNIDMLQQMFDFAIGDMINVIFQTSDVDKWDTLNGGWLLKSLSYIYPSDNTQMKLCRIGIGSLPDKYVKVGEK